MHDTVVHVANAFGLTDISSIQPLGGTATRKYAVIAFDRKFVVRKRPVEFSRAESIRFDHQCLIRLADANLPVPRPLTRANGDSWLVYDGFTYEILSWVEGTRFHQGDEKAIASAGAILGEFHQTLCQDQTVGEKPTLREDHPDLIEPYALQLLELSYNDEDQAICRRIIDEIAKVRSNLDSGLYESLPRTVIHGDFHPGNVYFTDSKVTGIYDFDYIGRQARIRDVCDGLMFFASSRSAVFDPDSIESLTQVFRPNAVLCGIFLNAYQEYAKLTELEWCAMPWMIRSRWIQMRLRGGRKVPETARFGFATRRFFNVISWLDETSAGFFSSLRNRA